jgi:import inner membrane translocase subunit TIM22
MDHLPRPQPWKRQITQPNTTPYSPFLLTDPVAYTEACVSRAAVTVVAAFVLGNAFGILLGGYSSIAPPITPPGVPDPPKIPIRYLMMDSWESTLRRGRRMGRNFSYVGGVYSGVECVIEKYRAKHDIFNPVAGGFVAGAVLAARQGPYAIAFGAVTFGLFSYGMELIMGGH